MLLYPELSQKILEIADGDEDFKIELTNAIYNGLIELRTVYNLGDTEKDEYRIQQIRHKLKPTLTIFGFVEIIDEMQKGKDIVEAEGFSESFTNHVMELNRLLEISINNVGLLMK